jgi:hypothetical protein
MFIYTMFYCAKTKPSTPRRCQNANDIKISSFICTAGSGTEAPLDDSTMDVSSRRFRAEFLQEWQGSADAPYFDPSTPRNITGLVGHPVRLLCRVKNLQNRTVSCSLLRIDLSGRLTSYRLGYKRTAQTQTL